MARELERLNADLLERQIAPITVGMGLHTGPLMLGTIGGEERVDCTAIGDSVNLAARIEGMTKLHGATVLISGETFEALEQPERFAIRQLDRVRVKGRGEPVEIHEVLDARLGVERAAIDAHAAGFDAALEQFRAGDFLNARGSFETCDTGDVAVAEYLRRCERMLATAPEAWDGVVTLDSK